MPGWIPPNARSSLRAAAFEQIEYVMRSAPPYSLTKTTLATRACVSLNRVESWLRLNPHAALKQPRTSPRKKSG